MGGIKYNRKGMTGVYRLIHKHICRGLHIGIK